MVLLIPIDQALEVLADAVIFQQEGILATVEQQLERKINKTVGLRYATSLGEQLLVAVRLGQHVEDVESQARSSLNLVILEQIFLTK